MRKLGLWLVSALIMLFASGDLMAQFNRSSIKKNNKRIAGFRGKKSGFGKEKRYNAIGFSVNALNYYGDIAPLPSKFSTDISFTRPAFGLSFSHRFGPRYTLMAQFMHGTLSGSDKESANPNDKDAVYRYWRNASFRNQINELAVTAYFDLFENQSTYISRVKWTPYIFLGVAGFTNNPEAQAPATDLHGNPLAEAGKWVKLRPLGTEGQYSTLDPTDANYGIKPYSSIQVAIPIGVGARFRLNEVMDLWADIGVRYTFTDYIDDVSRNYVNLYKLNSPLAEAMSYRTNELGASGNNTQPPTNPITYADPTNPSKSYTVQAGYGIENPSNIRGNKNNNDLYMVTSIRLTYIVGATFHKAKFR